MKVNFATVLLDIEGDPFKIAKKGAQTDQYGNPLAKKDAEDMTLGRAAKMALTSPRKEPEKGEQYFDDTMLAIKVAYGGELELTETEVTRINERAALTWATPEIPSRIRQLLKGEQQNTAKPPPATGENHE